MMIEFLKSLGVVALIIGIILLICIPIFVGIVIAMAVANWFNASGILWWSIVIFVALVIWGIIGKLSQ